MISPLVVIPARLQSSRFPRKVLAPINEKPMIVHVYERALEADVGPVIIAAAEKEVADVVRDYGGDVVLTNPNLPSGTDRIYQAIRSTSSLEKHNVFINVQGDVPTIDPYDIKCITRPFELGQSDISTLVAEIKEEEEKNNPNVVKAVLSFDNEQKSQPIYAVGRALYFSRSRVPSGEDSVLYHHVGVYAYSSEALKRFVRSAPSTLEVEERLEQLRALEMGLNIHAVVIKSAPRGVDTQEDLEIVSEILSDKKVA